MSFDAAAWAALPPVQRDLACAYALGATGRPLAWLARVLAEPALREAPGPRPDEAGVRAAQRGLREGGWLVPDVRRPGVRVDAAEFVGVWRLADDRLAGVSEALMARASAEDLRGALARAEGFAPQRAAAMRFPSYDAALAWLRLEALAGAGPARFAALAPSLPWTAEGVESLVDSALGLALDDALFARLHPAVQRLQLMLALRQVDLAWRSVDHWDWQAWAERVLAQPTDAQEHLGGGDPDGGANRGADGGEIGDVSAVELRWTLAEHALWAGDFARVSAWLMPTLSGQPARKTVVYGAVYQAFQAAVAAHAGQWAEAEAGFDEALGVLRKATGKRRALLFGPVAIAYALTLLATQRPDALDKALKFCLSEGGSREPMLDTPFGVIALAILMQQGTRPRDLTAFRPARLGEDQVSTLDPWRWLMRAWLKQGAQAEALSAFEREAARALRERLRACGLHGLLRWVDGALAVLDGESPPAGFFIGGVQERWQVALQALDAVVAAEQPASASGEAVRWLWLLAVDAQGRPERLTPHEQKRGARGWSKPKPVPLSRAARSAESLPEADARLARVVRQELLGREHRIDLAQALPLLVGHPAWAFEEAPDQLMTLAEASPELDVQPEGTHALRVRMLPTVALASESAAARWPGSVSEQKAQDALNGVCVWRESSQQARFVKLTAAQRRVAQLLGPNGLEVPRSGAAQLQQVLSGLGSHFRIHADDEGAGPAAAREVPAVAALRAELVPVGPGLQLRLVAAPFGPAHRAEGPRLVPGSGRARVVAPLCGETLGVVRDLAAERSHFERVLDACAMLPEPLPQAPAEWLLDDAEQALALVHALHGLPRDVVEMDWPQGQPLRVATADVSQLTLRVHTRQEWLAVQGDLTVDDGLVIGLQQLIGAATAKSRFVPLGEGRYLALTQELRDRLADLGAVADAQAVKGEGVQALRVPRIAAPWLREAAQGAREVDFDPAFTEALHRLDGAQRLVPALPAGLQAQLRPYQEEGFEWAMRLAHAGLGACLADDMGLGKTLQALAVLLARAPLGPALVVVPTSVLGNWRQEARRFAPSLRLLSYAEQGAAADRASSLNALGAFDVVLVSYPLLLADSTAFAAVQWSSLVLDEAQTIKNAAAKRSQAVFALPSAFTLALSGTPVENRLGELWSIMRACNPGLLGSAARFAERFAGPIERQHDRQAQRRLRRLISPFILRRTKAQVLDDLPPRTELFWRVQGDEAERAHYEALRRDALVAAERSLEGDAPGQAHLNVLAGLTRLRRAACDPRLVTPQLGRPGAKVQAFAELAAELAANGHKALVFSQFVDFLALLREPLDAAGLSYQYLDGSTSAAERTRRAEAFQSGQGDFFLISLKAGGLGLNLTVADYVVIADPWWNPAAEDQATGRAHRMGQTRPVTVYRLVHEGTLEEKILTLHRDKRDLADSLLDGADAPRHLPPAAELLALMRGDDATAELYRPGEAPQLLG